MPNQQQQAPSHPAAPKASRLNQMLSTMWGEPEHYEETRTMALVAQARALEGIENAVTLLAAELLEALEELTDVIRAGLEPREELSLEELLEALEELTDVIRAGREPREELSLEELTGDEPTHIE